MTVTNSCLIVLVSTYSLCRYCPGSKLVFSRNNTVTHFSLTLYLFSDSKLAEISQCHHALIVLLYLLYFCCMLYFGFLQKVSSEIIFHYNLYAHLLLVCTWVTCMMPKLNWIFCLQEVSYYEMSHSWHCYKLELLPCCICTPTLNYFYWCWIQFLQKVSYSDFWQ